MNKRIALLIVLGLGPLAARAETAYVTDMLRLGIHQAEDTSDRPFDNLVSGTELEVLERVPNFALVRTPDGRQGWVKSAYLVAERPAQARIQETEAELGRVRAELTTAKAAQQSAEAAAGELTRQAADSSSSAEAIEDTLARLKQENEGYEQQLDDYRGALPLKWVAAALVLAVIGGFAAGWWWLDASIRRRHGGFRVY